MSAERPRRSEPPGASGGAAGEGTAAAPGGRLREGARHERRNLHHPPHSRVVRGFAGASREGGGAALRSAALRECEGKSAGAPSCFERSEKQSWAAPKGHGGPESPRPSAEGGTTSPQGEPCERMRADEPPRGAGERPAERPLRAPRGIAAPESGCMASKAKGPLRAPLWGSVG